MVLTLGLLLLGAAVLLLALFDRSVRRLPLSPALIYLAIGVGAGALFEVPGAQAIVSHAPALLVGSELAVLVSLIAVGLRLRVLASLKAWRVALLLAGPGMVVTVLLGAAAAHWLLQMPWALALLLAAVVSPTDPVLASDVQIRSEQDRDAVRLSLTAEGGINDGSALPLVMLALAALGLHELGGAGTGPAALQTAAGWWNFAGHDLLWPVGGGALIGAGVGHLMGSALKRRALRGDTLERDELLYGSATLLALGLGHATQTSSFVVAFVLAATMLRPLHALPSQALAERLHAFGSRCERLVEAASVLAIGVALTSIVIGWPELLFGVAVALVVRPLAVLAVVRPHALPKAQRRLVAWFGIRGVGSLFYLLFALEHGVEAAMADRLMSATLVCIAVSIVLHGVSATPLMAAYQARRAAGRR